MPESLDAHHRVGHVCSQFLGQSVRLLRTPAPRAALLTGPIYQEVSREERGRLACLPERVEPKP